MGDFLSKAPSSFTDYKPTGRSISHPILGEFPILQSQSTGQAILQKKINIAQLEGANKSVLRSHLLLNHPNIVRFEGYEQLTSTEHNVYFENFDCTLKQEIQRRAASNTRFTEKEIVELLRCISSALAYLQGNRIVHGQIRTETIVKVGAEYKLLNMTVFGNYKSTYQQALEEMRKTQIRLLSPQLQDALYNKIVDPVHEGYKDDVYALGVVTLDVMTLSIDTGIPVSEKLARATQVYSKTLLSVVNKMLENIMSLRLDCISCSRVIENNYVHRDYSSNSNSQAFSASKLLQRSSVRSSYRNDEPDRLTTGVSLNDIKKYSPAYRKSEKTMQEQYFSPTKHDGRERPEYREPSSNYNMGRRSTYSIDMGKGFEHLRPQANEPILAKSYFQEQVYQSPQHPPLSSAQNLNLKSHRTSSVPKNRYQGWESNTASGYSQNPPLYKSGYQVHVSAPEKPYNSTANQPNFAERNLSPLIKNDPFILSLLSQDPAHNNSSQTLTQKPENKDYILKSSAFNSEYEKAKSPAVFSTPEHGGYKIYRAVESGDAAKIYYNGSNPESVNYQASNYGISTSPQLNHSVQPPFAFQLYPAQPGAQPSIVSPNVYVPLAQVHHTTTNLSEPMAIDNSPIYTGYSQIQEDVHKNGRGGESFISRSSIKYS